MATNSRVGHPITLGIPKQPNVVLKRWPARDAGRRELPRDRRQFDLAHQVAGGGVDQRDGVGAPPDLVPVTVRPGADGDAAHRMPRQHGALTRAECRLEYAVKVGGQVTEAIPAAARNAAAPWPRWSNATTR
jgi:hypothetical protein